MEKKFEFTKVLKNSGERAWEILRSLDGVDAWFPMVKSCRVDSSGAVPRRYCQLADGLDIEESIVAIDDEQRAVHYTVDKGLPVDRYRGVFAVHRRDDGQEELRWTVEVDGPAPVVAEVEALLGQAAESALLGLDTAAGAAA